MKADAIVVRIPLGDRRRRGRPPSPSGAETQSRILRAAREVISEVGYDAATFTAIALRAGLTRPAINYYYADKVRLYEAVVQDANAAIFVAGFKAAIDEPTLLGQIQAFIAAAIQPDSEDRSAAAFLVTSVLESQRHPDLRGTEADTTTQLRGFLTLAVTSAIARDEISADIDVTSMVEMLLALLWGIGFYAGFAGHQDTLDAVARQLGRLMVSGL